MMDFDEDNYSTDSSEREQGKKLHQTTKNLVKILFSLNFPFRCQKSNHRGCRGRRNGSSS